MTLEETLLQKLAEWQPPAGEKPVLPVLFPEVSTAVTFTVDRHEMVGSSVWELRVQRPARTPESLRSWADGVLADSAGLLEPLQLIEVDTVRSAILVRSEKPRRRGDDLFYYEVILTGTGEATARRFRAPQDQGQREQVPYALTHEVLARFAANLAQA